MPERLLHPGLMAPEPAGLVRSEWSGVPKGFEVYQLGPGERTLVVKASSRDALLDAGVQDPRGLGSGPLVTRHLAGGRVRHALVSTKGEEWVLKAYRRGGLLGRWNSERYWGSSRFLDELVVAAHAERSGVATAEVLALIVERAGLGSVRAWLVTRYLHGAKPLGDYFGTPEQRAVFRAAGQVVRRMHLAGIDHHDLHLGNIMGSLEDGRAQAYIVDWDRARVLSDGAWSPYGNLSRLWRSVLKGRRKDELAELSRPVRAFIRGYFDGSPADLRETRAYIRRQAIWMSLRRVLRGDAR